jgi:quinol monooxygenase YgiN
MIGVIATLKIKPGMNKQFEEIATKLVAAVRANEPGNKLYALHRTDDAETYIFLERYVDQAAIEAHRAQPHFKELGKKMGEFMAGRPDVKVLQEVG